MSFGSIDADAGAEPPSVAHATLSFASATARPSTSVASSALGTVDPSQDENEPGDWTPVTRRTSRTHRERSTSSRSKSMSSSASESDLESTSNAARKMSHNEIMAAVWRHESIAAELRAQLERKSTSPENDSSEMEEPVKPGRALSSHRTTIEDFEDGHSVPSLLADVIGPSSSRNKGKDFGHGNWGDVSFLENFAENELKAQHDALENFEQIHRVKRHERVTTPREVLVDVDLPHRPKSEAKKALKSDGRTPKSDTKASELKPAAPRLDQPKVHKVEPQPRSNASRRDSKTDHGDMSGQTHLTNEEQVAQLYQMINELERQRAENDSPKVTKDKRDSKSPMMPKVRAVTPGRLAAGSFLDKALRGAYKTGQNPPPSDSSGSSSSSSSNSSSSNSDGSGSRRRHSSPRRSAKRKRGSKRHKMLIHRFAREASTYVKMGQVAEDDQVFFISYYLDGKAKDSSLNSLNSASQSISVTSNGSA